MFECRGRTVLADAEEILSLLPSEESGDAEAPETFDDLAAKAANCSTCECPCEPIRDTRTTLGMSTHERNKAERFFPLPVLRDLALASKCLSVREYDNHFAMGRSLDSYDAYILVEFSTTWPRRLVHRAER